MASETSIHRFGAFALDLHRGKVSGPAGDVLLRPKAYALLTYLAKNVGRVVPKDELLDVVWPNVYVQESSLTQAVREVRKGLGESAELLRNVSGRGYMLTGESEPALRAVGNRPVVAVLRFRNDNEAATDSVLIDGFAEDVVSGLARFGTLTAIARSSSFQFASFAGLDDRQGAEKLGADYLVEGAISRHGEAAIITIGLSDARTQARLWGERYDAAGLELFAVQRDVASQIVNRIIQRLGETTLVRAQSVAPKDLTAYDLVIRASSILNHYGSEEPATALRYVEAALARDTDYAPAHAYRALATIMEGGMGLASPAVLDDARGHANKAVTLAPDDAAAFRILATVQIFQRQHDAAEASLRTSLELNPSDADTVGLMGHLLILRGRPLDGHSWLDRATRLNPVHPQWYGFSRALGCYQLGEFTESLRLLRQLPETLPHVGSLIAAAAAKAQRSPAEVAALAKALPAEDVEGNLLGWEHPGDHAHMREGERLAREMSAI